MIKAFITITLGLLVLNIMAICKAAGDADREWEENIGQDNSGRERTGQGPGDKTD